MQDGAHVAGRQVELLGLPAQVHVQSSQFVLAGLGHHGSIYTAKVSVVCSGTSCRQPPVGPAGARMCVCPRRLGEERTDVLVGWMSLLRLQEHSVTSLSVTRCRF